MIKAQSLDGLFEKLLDGKSIFKNKEVLRPSYTPDLLLHRNEQINSLATILVSALRAETPSNVLIYGKTGTGKLSLIHISEPTRQAEISYAVFCLKKKKK